MITRPGRRVAVRTLAALMLLPALAAGPGSASPQPPQSPPSMSGGAPAAMPAARGTWRVDRTGDGTWTVSWRSPTRLPVTSARPEIVREASVLGPTLVGADGRTVSVTVRAATAPDPAQLDVVLSGDRLDVAGNDREAAVAPVDVVRPVPSTTLPEDPAEPGPFAVVSSDYELEPVKVKGMKAPIEMVGHVVAPAPGEATGPRPLVLFLHGRHSFCYKPGTQRDSYTWPCEDPFIDVPSHLGYTYLQQVLASQGFATVSIRVNGINAQDGDLPDGGAGARGVIVRHHLDHWASLAAAEQLDLSRVVLVGHSRGGEGVHRATLATPLDAPYRIVGQVLIAPVDFSSQTAAYVPTVTLLPYCDGDVSDLQGQRFTDNARDLTTDDTALKSSVLVLGANHNFFNTEWTPGEAAAPAWDDWGGGSGACGPDRPQRLTAPEQRAVGLALVAGAVRLFADDEQQFLPLFDGTAARVASQGRAITFSHAIAGGRVTRRPGLDASLSPAVGAASQLCVGAFHPRQRPRLCGRGIQDWSSAPHWPRAGDPVVKRKELEVAWTAAGQSAGLVLASPLDLSGGRLELRTIADPDVRRQRLQVRLTDADGQQAVLTPADAGRLADLPRGWSLSKRWAQGVLVDTSGAAGLDLTRITGVDLVGASEAGHVWVLDVSAAPEVLPGVPARRLPVLDLGRLVLDETDAPQAVAVPFTLSAPLTTPATVVLAGTPSEVVHLAAGQTGGTIDVQVAGSTRDSLARTRYPVVVLPRAGVMPGAWTDQVVVRDDDPAPTLSLEPLSRVVAEGRDLAWRLRLSAPTDYWILSKARFVGAAGSRPQLRVRDLDRTWLRASGLGDRPSRWLLFRSRIQVWGEVQPGETGQVIRIPTRRDRLREGREIVAVKVRVLRLGRSFTRRFRVADR